MNYAIVKLHFTSPVHFGAGVLSGGSNCFCADTLFSALYLEALKTSKKKAQHLYELCTQNRLWWSDSFPYSEDRIYLPKPLVRISSNKEINPGERKKFKKLEYIAADLLEDYLEGNFNLELNSCPASISYTVAKNTRRDPNDPNMYYVGEVVFVPGTGLYVIVAYKDKSVFEYFSDLLKSLSVSGIGGKRSIGKGQFKFTLEKNPLVEKHVHLCSDSNMQTEESTTKRNCYFMLISGALPESNDLAAVLDGAEGYLLQKRSGFIYSTEGIQGTAVKKKDLYIFKSGSCFVNSFAGKIYDVSPEKAEHEVLRYAKAMFWELK